MKRLDQITSIVLFMLSVFYVAEALKMPLRAGKSPGAGWLPLILGILMILLSVLLLVSAARRPASADSVVTWPTGRGLINNLSILGCLAVSIVVLETAGYLASTFVFLLILFFVLGKYSWKFSVPFALGSAIALYWLFKVWLNIPLPAGFIDFV